MHGLCNSGTFHRTAAGQSGRQASSRSQVIQAAAKRGTRPSILPADCARAKRSVTKLTHDYGDDLDGTDVARLGASIVLRSASANQPPLELGGKRSQTAGFATFGTRQSPAWTVVTKIQAGAREAQS